MTDPAKSGERGVMDLLRSSKAIVGRRQVHSDCGGATIHCVVLADGALIECGSDGWAEDRARLEADDGHRLIQEGRDKLESARRRRQAARKLRDSVFEVSHAGR